MITDAGTTRHFMMQGAPFINVKMMTNQIRIVLPNENQMVVQEAIIINLGRISLCHPNMLSQEAIHVVIEDMYYGINMDV